MDPVIRICLIVIVSCILFMIWAVVYGKHKEKENKKIELEEKQRKEREIKRKAEELKNNEEQLLKDITDYCYTIRQYYDAQIQNLSTFMARYKVKAEGMAPILRAAVSQETLNKASEKYARYPEIKRLTFDFENDVKISFECTHPNGLTAAEQSRILKNAAAAMSYKPSNIPQKEKSVVGQAVAGGIIAGPAGAVVGALNAVDKNNKIRSEKNK